MESRTKFSVWLTAELDTQSLSLRGLARRIADKEATTSTETVRRTLIKYVHEARWPREPMRRAIASALNVDPDSMPTEADEDEDAALQALMRDPEFLKKLKPLARMLVSR
jgi:hypothetical protein